MGAEGVHTIDNMYGVIHGGTKVRLFMFEEEFGVHPSISLMHQLRGLPPGTCVGIEDFDPREVKRETYKVNGGSFRISKEARYYWDALRDICGNLGLQVAYLDDFR